MKRRELIKAGLAGLALLATTPALAKKKKHSRAKKKKYVHPQYDTTHLANSFPPGFVWGVTSASGRLENYDTSAMAASDGTPGTSAYSTDLYVNAITMLKRMNLKSLQLALRWDRLLPSGSGTLDDVELDNCKRILDAALLAGIRPTLILNQRAIPAALAQAGGWTQRDTATRFADYAHLIGTALGDRVPRWILLNDPFTALRTTTQEGRNFLVGSHHVNLAQGHSFRALKSVIPNSELGSAYDLAPAFAATPAKADVDAAERWSKLVNYWFLDPAFRGTYPSGVLPDETLAEALEIKTGDDALVKANLDFVGVNYYSRYTVHHDPRCAIPGLLARGDFGFGPHEKAENTWDIYPQGLYDILKLVSRRVGTRRDIEVSANGVACNIGASSDGKVRDQARISYLQDHLKAVASAVRDHVPVRAFHATSLIDTLTDRDQTAYRFGILYADSASPSLTVKESGWWLAGVAAANKVM